MTHNTNECCYDSGSGSLFQYCIIICVFSQDLHYCLQVNARPENGKLEQSYISFQQEHPNWTGDEAGRSMLHRLKSFRAMKEHQQDCELSSVLQSSMMFGGGGGGGIGGGGSVMNMHGQHLPPSSPPRRQQQQSGIFKAPPGSVPVPPGVTPSFSSSQRPASSLPPQGTGDGSSDSGGGGGGGCGPGTKGTIPGGLGGIPEGGVFSQQPQPGGDQGQGGRISSPDTSGLPAYMRNSIGSPAGRRGGGGGGFSQQSMEFSRRSGNNASSLLGRGGGGGGVQNMPSMLRSILRNENIDYENDFYWLSKVRKM